MSTNMHGSRVKNRLLVVSGRAHRFVRPESIAQNGGRAASGSTSFRPPPEQHSHLPHPSRKKQNRLPIQMVRRTQTGKTFRRCDRQGQITIHQRLIHLL